MPPARPDTGCRMQDAGFALLFQAVVSTVVLTLNSLTLNLRSEHGGRR